MDTTKAQPSRRRSTEVLDHVRRTFSLDDASGVTILRNGKPIRVSTPKNPDHYCKVHIGRFDGHKVKWKRAQLVFFLAHGYLPPEIDHEDGNRHNDSLSSLRPASRSQNQSNKKRQRNANAFGRGVVKKGQCYRPWVKVGGKIKWLGYFTTPEEASAVAKAARENLAGEFLPGPNRYRIKKRRKAACPKPVTRADLIAAGFESRAVRTTTPKPNASTQPRKGKPKVGGMVDKLNSPPMRRFFMNLFR